MTLETTVEGQPFLDLTLLLIQNVHHQTQKDSL